LKIVIKKDKGWFKALGLHHAAITAIFILITHLFGFGDYGAAIMIGWYARHEYGYGPKPPKVFEILDFLSPVIVSGFYFYLL
jgi:hypothetical protein